MPEGVAGVVEIAEEAANVVERVGPARSKIVDI